MFSACVQDNNTRLKNNKNHVQKINNNSKQFYTIILKLFHFIKKSFQDVCCCSNNCTLLKIGSQRKYEGKQMHGDIMVYIDDMHCAHVRKRWGGGGGGGGGTCALMCVFTLSVLPCPQTLYFILIVYFSTHNQLLCS